jgi:hypothetical protein
MLGNSLKRVVNLDGNDECANVVPSAPKKRATGIRKAAKKTVKPVVKKEEDDDGARNWSDEEVRQMIAMWGEMDAEFTNGTKKQSMHSQKPFRIWLGLCL